MQLTAPTIASALAPTPAPHNRDADGTAQLTLAQNKTLDIMIDLSTWACTRLALEGAEGTLQC